MKMRQHKRRVLALMMINNFLRNAVDSWESRARGLDDWVGHNDPKLTALGELLLKRVREEELQAVDPMVIEFMKLPMASEEELQSIEEAKQEFVCVRVSDGTVVDTFDCYEDADQLVHKHTRQKKAKLQVLDSLTGEIFQPADFQ